MRKSRVLCVEDDRATQELLRMALANEVDEWIEAYDGEEACKILHEQRVDILLLDIDLPKIRGTEILKRVRQRGMDLAIVVISGEAKREDLVEMINYDANYFLEKPIDLPKLKNVMHESILSKRKRMLLKKDALTGVLNRHALIMQIERWIKSDRNFTLMVVDLDNFKPINDNYGHLTGDQVLREVAQRLQQRLRKSDIVGRWGGDEFVVAIEGTQGDGEIVRKKILQAFEEPIEGFRIEASIGSTYFEGKAECFEELFAVADRRMYEHKRQKRS